RHRTRRAPLEPAEPRPAPARPRDVRGGPLRARRGRPARRMSAVPGRRRAPGRAEVLEEFGRVGREHSDATVLFHGVMAGLLDLHPTDYKTLGILERLGPMSAGEIASHSGLASASVTNLLDRLERKGFVRRVRDAADRRRVLAEPVMDRLT